MHSSLVSRRGREAHVREHVAHLIAHATQRVQRHDRFLEHQRDAGAAQVPQRDIGSIEEIDAAEADGAREV